MAISTLHSLAKLLKTSRVTTSLVLALTLQMPKNKKIEGFELDSMIFFSENFFTTLGVQYLDAEFVEHTFGTCDRTRSGDPTDDCLPM